MLTESRVKAEHRTVWAAWCGGIGQMTMMENVDTRVLWPKSSGIWSVFRSRRLIGSTPHCGQGATAGKSDDILPPKGLPRQPDLS